MSRVSDRELVAQWRRHFKNQPLSGLSIDKYCQREGIKAGTFYAWKRRLKVSKATAASRRGTTSKREPARARRTVPREPVALCKSRCQSARDSRSASSTARN